VDPWVIDELAYAGPEHLDPAYVAGYDRKGGSDPAEDVASLQAHGCNSSSTLVDLGAGTGRFAAAAAQSFGHVVAVDVSPAMLDLQRSRVAELGLSNVDCVQAGLLTYAHAGPPVDAVYTRNALHHLPDFWKAVALDRIARILKPDGILRVRDLIYDFQPAQADEYLGRWFDGAVEDPREGYTRDELQEHVRTEHSSFRWLFEPMLLATGFEIVEADFRRSVYGTYTCVRR
jgi:ubiquinone/menaquinone biosynthesis C-methylase UbiE